MQHSLYSLSSRSSYSSSSSLIKPFIFDFDGVVVDSQQHWDKLSQQHLAKLIPGWTTEDDRKMKGHSAKDNHQLLVEEYGATFSYEEFVTHVSEMAVGIYARHAQLTEGMADLLIRLRSINPALPSIASASRRDWLNVALDRFHLRDSFELITTTEEVERSKPFPDVYLKAAEKLGADPIRCIAVEDTNVGLRAAKSAGMFCIGFHAPGHDEQELAEADLHISGFDELTEEVLRGL